MGKNHLKNTYMGFDWNPGERDDVDNQCEVDASEYAFASPFSAAPAPTEISARFDLEQQIMDCWHLTADLTALTDQMEAEKLPRSDIRDIVLGLSKLYEIKF